MAASLDATLLIDGYNIIGAWTPRAMKRHPSKPSAQQRDDLEAARAELIGELANYSAFQGYQTRLIFDAHQRRESPGNSEFITDWLEIYYTEFGETADCYIEQYCAKARFRDRNACTPARLIVATSDRAQQLTVIGYGAEWISAQQLLHDIEGIALKIQRKQRSHRKASARLLAHSLDPEAKRQLEKWRNGLS